MGLGVIGETSGLWVHASPVADDDVTDEIATQASELRAALRALFEALGGRRLTEVLRGVDDPSALADLAGWWPDLGVERKIELLETLDLSQRLSLVLRWTKDALAEHELSEKIRNDVTEGLEDRQREFLLRQQMDAIRKELGEDEEDSVEGYRERLEKLVEAGAVTGATQKAIGREIDRFERTPEQNVEHGWIRNWLDTVFEIPWGERSVDDYDIDRARAVLDADHTGLDEVKERIVEMLAVRKLLAERAAEERQPRRPSTTIPASRPTPRSTSRATTAPTRSTRRPFPSSPRSRRATTAASRAPSWRWPALPGSARRRSAPPSPGPSAGSSPASPWAASATRPRSEATGAPTSAPRPAASSGRCRRPAP